MPDLVMSKALREKRFKLAKEMHQVVQDAGEEGLRGENLDKWNKMNEDCDAMAQAIEAAERSEQLVGEFHNPDETPPPGTPKHKRDDAVTARDRGLAMRAWMKQGSALAPTDRELEAAQKCSYRLDANEIQLRLGPGSGPYVDTRSSTLPMNTTTAAQGEVTFNDDFIASVESKMADFGGVRRHANVIRTAAGNTLKFPTYDGTSDKGKILAQNTAATTAMPTFGEVSFGAYKYTSDIVLISNELLNDSAINMPAFIGGICGERIARIQADHLATGAGSSATQPAGIAGASTSMSSKLGATSSTYNQVIFTELMNLQHSVDPAYRRSPKCMWFFNDDFLNYAKQVTISSSENVPLWLPSVSVGAPDTILGYPFEVDQSLAKLSTDSAQRKVVVFGDMSKFWIRDVAHVGLRRLNERYAEYDQTAFVMFTRMDAGSIQYDAIKHLITASSS